jgi:hypothetical protein
MLVRNEPKLSLNIAKTEMIGSRQRMHAHSNENINIDLHVAMQLNKLTKLNH